MCNRHEYVDFGGVFVFECDTKDVSARETPSGKRQVFEYGVPGQDPRVPPAGQRKSTRGSRLIDPLHDPYISRVMTRPDP